MRLKMSATTRTGAPDPWSESARSAGIRSAQVSIVISRVETEGSVCPGGTSGWHMLQFLLSAIILRHSSRRGRAHREVLAPADDPVDGSTWRASAGGHPEFDRDPAPPDSPDGTRRRSRPPP